MEEIEIRDALLRHVGAAEPPMRLSAAGLLEAGRRHGRWRLGTSLASAGVATALAVAGSMTLLPSWGNAPFGNETCAVPLAPNFSPRPSAWEPQPSGTPLDPSPMITSSPIITSSPNSTTFSSPSPTVLLNPSLPPDPSPQVTPEAEYGSPSPGSTVRSYQYSSPTAQPGEDPTPDPAWTAGPHFLFPTESPPGDPAKMRAMECYLKESMKTLVPGATYAEAFGNAPLTVASIWAQQFGRYEVGYCATSIIIDSGETVQFDLCTEPTWQRPTGPEHGWSYREDDGAVLTHLRRDDGLLLIRVYLEHSMVNIAVTGQLFTAEQLEDLANAAELDITG